MGLVVTNEMVTLLAIQLPATLLLGLASGSFAVHIIRARRGRMSPRANSALVLSVALEASAITQNPGAWLLLLGLFFPVATAMALADLAVILGLDSLRPIPRAGRLALVLIPTVLVLIGLMISGLFKYVVALNPDAVSLLDLLGWCFALLASIALFDLAVRMVIRKVNRGARVK